MERIFFPIFQSTSDSCQINRWTENVAPSNHGRRRSRGPLRVDWVPCSIEQAIWIDYSGLGHREVNWSNYMRTVSFLAGSGYRYNAD